jgi:hypothetical protein
MPVLPKCVFGKHSMVAKLTYLNRILVTWHAKNELNPRLEDLGYSWVVGGTWSADLSAAVAYVGSMSVSKENLLLWNQNSLPCFCSAEPLKRHSGAPTFLSAFLGKKHNS